VIQIRRVLICGFLLTFLYTLCAVSAFGWGGHKYESAVVDENIGKVISIVPQSNKIHTGFGQFSLGEFYYLKSVDRIFFSDSIKEATIKEIDFDDEQIVVDLENAEDGIGKIVYIFSKEQYENIDRVKFSEILFSTLSDPDLSLVVPNNKTGKYHLPSSNHLPQGLHEKISKNDAEIKGLVACGFCFKHFIYLPGYNIEQEIAREVAAKQRHYSPVSHDDVKQIELSRVGHRVLSQWPIDLLGYDYSFVLLDSSEVNAFALPGGQVFFTTGLFDSLEDPLELEAILAHEIAHVENRHGLKSYFKAQELQETQAALAAIGGLAVGMAASRGHGGAATGALGVTLTMMAMVDFVNKGYSIDHEKEADLFAGAYFDKIAANRESLLSVFRKLQFVNLCRVEDPDPESYTHPQLKERVEAAKAGHTVLYNSDVFLLKKNEVKDQVKIKPLLYSSDGYLSYFYVYIDNKKFIKNKMNGFDVNNVEIILGKTRNYIFEFDKKSTIYTEFGAILRFKSSKNTSIGNSEITEMTLRTREEDNNLGLIENNHIFIKI